MASKKVDVAVHEGDRLVARLTARPVRLMPDGYAGVVYNGAVHPLCEAALRLNWAEGHTPSRLRPARWQGT